MPNYGKGLITYITADSGTEEIKSDNMLQAIEDLSSISLGTTTLHSPDMAGGAAAARASGVA